MSDATDAVRSAVTDEWQTTREIADIASFVACVSIKPSRAYDLLAADLKYGLVERTREGKQTLWRKRRCPTS